MKIHLCTKGHKLRGWMTYTYIYLFIYLFKFINLGGLEIHFIFYLFKSFLSFKLEILKQR